MNKSGMKWLMWGGLVVSVLLALVIALISIRRDKIYDQRITVQACYQQYACDNCLHMKVISVDHGDFGFAVGQDVFPYSKHLNVEDYIVEHHHLPARPFALTGRLHKYKQNPPFLALTPDAFRFQVEQIEYLAQRSCP